MRECVTHHHACDCREALFEQMRSKCEQLEAAAAAIPAEAEPVAWMFKFLGGVYFGVADGLSRPETTPLYTHPRPSLPEGVRAALSTMDFYESCVNGELQRSINTIRAFVREVTGE